MSESHDGAIFRPLRPTASKAVTVCAEEEETGFDDSLTREWVGSEALDSWLRDPIHVSKVFVPSFVSWTNLSFQVVNEGSVFAENLDELLLCVIDLSPSITVVSSAWVTTWGI